MIGGDSKLRISPTLRTHWLVPPSIKGWIFQSCFAKRSINERSWSLSTKRAERNTTGRGRSNNIKLDLKDIVHAYP